MFYEEASEVWVCWFYIPGQRGVDSTSEGKSSTSAPLVDSTSEGKSSTSAPLVDSTSEGKSSTTWELN